MPADKPMGASPLELDKEHRAGNVVGFPGGLVSYLAPLPLRTGQPAQDYAHAVGEVNDIYLDFGVGLPPVFGWQLTLGGPLGGWAMFAILFPLLVFVGTPLLGGGLTDSIEMAVGVFEHGVPVASATAFFTLAIGMFVWLHKHLQHRNVIPTRFNRQRREVCFVPEGHTEPIFVPWESLSAWVIQAQGATQYGIQRQYAMGVGFHHAESGQDFSLEFPCAGLPLAIANWEAIRAYMEYQVHSLKEIQDPLDLQGPDDPPHEGLHTFRNARERMRRRYSEGEVGAWYVFGWYLYHVMTLWTLPFRLTEWEVGRVKRMHRQDIPEAMQAWSQPLPPEQWAKPSEELLKQGELLENLRLRKPQDSIFELMAEVGRSASNDMKQMAAEKR